jgi:acyl carrier protein
MNEVPMTKEEQYVYTLFCSVLKKEEILMEENFFSQGGDSMDVVQLLATIQKERGKVIDGIEFMNACTVKEFAKIIERETKAGGAKEEKQVTQKDTAEVLNIFSRLAAALMDSVRNFMAKVRSLLNPVTVKHCDSTLEELIGRQLLLLESWPGVRKTKRKLVRGKNLEGTMPNLFWCFQAGQEFEDLALNLGTDRPLFGLRSGHLLFSNNPLVLKQLAGIYVEEILQIQPQGPFFLGGNCQGGQVAWEMAHLLKSLGHRIGTLYSMEVNRKEYFDDPIVLIYGSESEKFNPYLYEEDPEKDWNKYYASYSVKILKGEHGTYFSPESIPNLAKILVS